MMTGCGIGISTDLLQNFVVDKICLSIVVIRNPIVQPVAVAFFFFFFPIRRQLGCGGGRAMEEKEREKRVVKEKEIDLYLFFFSLEIGMECNK